MKDNHFKLSSSFKNLFSSKGSSKEKKQNSSSAEKALFKLNPNSANNLNDIPVDVLRKKSKTKLQSLKDQANSKKFSILNQKVEEKEIVTEKKNVTKKYNLQMGSKRKSKQRGESSGPGQVEELPSDIVRPSQLTSFDPKFEETPVTLFQTPILPCFASQFARNAHNTQFKEIKEKQGVWKIGKIKMKGKTAKLVIGGIQFDANMAEVEGKAGAVNEATFFQMPKWNGIWVVQPNESLFN